MRNIPPRFIATRLDSPRLALCLGLAVFAWLPCLSIGQEAKSDSKPESVVKPKTVPVTVANIQSDVVFAATFAPLDASEVSVSLKTVPALKVEEVVPHGSAVKQGDALIRFDTDSLKEQLEAQERTVVLLRLNLEEAEREAKLIEIQVPLDKEQAELTKKQADEDFAYYQKFEKEFNEKSNEQRLKSMRDAMDYTAEELRQLEKMYKADDLTEESEEIVLRRARDDLERQKFSLEQTEMLHRKTKELSLPRVQRDRKTALRMAEIAWERFQLTFPLQMEKRSLGLAKTRQELQKGLKTLEQLREDLKACDVKSPRTGIVYYGRVQAGKWVGVAELRTKLKKYGSVGSNEVLMTVVSPDNLQIVGSVPEADVTRLRVGGSGKIIPAAMKKERLDVVVKSIATIPSGEGQFDVSLELVKSNRSIVAGMTGSVRVTDYFAARALTLPLNVVFTDESDDTIRYVYSLSDEGKPVRKNVDVGVVQGERIEIRSGIVASESILAEKPKSE